MRAWKEDLVFRDEVAKDEAISALLTRKNWRKPSIIPAVGQRGRDLQAGAGGVATMKQAAKTAKSAARSSLPLAAPNSTPTWVALRAARLLAHRRGWNGQSRSSVICLAGLLFRCPYGSEAQRKLFPVDGDGFSGQEGYGAFSVSPSQVEVVKDIFKTRKSITANAILSRSMSRFYGTVESNTTSVTSSGDRNGGVLRDSGLWVGPATHAEARANKHCAYGAVAPVLCGYPGPPSD